MGAARPGPLQTDCKKALWGGKAGTGKRLLEVHPQRQKGQTGDDYLQPG